MDQEDLSQVRAVIDLGTNTFNLLIGRVEGDRITQIIHADRYPVMLGMGGINEHRITDDAYERAIHALRHFKALADQYDCHQVKGFGTSAMRDAVNGQQLINEVWETLGFAIELIDGEQEARLIYQGVQMTYEFKQAALIMDIGGGSTEFALADENGLAQVLSLNIGVSRIYQELGKPEEFTEEQIERVYRYLDDQNRGRLDAFKSRILIGSSGTFETFYEMLNRSSFKSEGRAVLLQREEFNRLLKWSIRSSYHDRMEHPWIIPIRKNMQPIAAIKVDWVIQKLGIEEIWLSPYSLKEGAILE